MCDKYINKWTNKYKNKMNNDTSLSVLGEFPTRSPSSTNNLCLPELRND